MSSHGAFTGAAKQQLALARQQRVRDAMRQYNVPALLILDSINILYATGASNMTVFSTRTPARYLLLLAEGPTILYEYFGCEHLAEGLKTIDEVRTARGLCFVSSGGDMAAEASAMARETAEVVREFGGSVDTLAVDRFPYSCIDALRDQGFQLTDADQVLSSARAIKLPAEISFMTEALDRVAAATEVMVAGIEPGRSEVEVWADFSKPFIATEGQYIVTRLLQSGLRTYPYFQEASNHQLAAGDLLCFDTDTIGFEGYCTDFSRTYLCGDKAASAEQCGLYAKAKDQLDHNVALIKAGASYEEIAHAAWPIPQEHQASRYYCIGHGLGMSGEHPNIPHAVPNERYPLDGQIEQGMVICIESYVGSEKLGQGVKLEDQLWVSETGTQCMSSKVPIDDRLLLREF